MIHTINDDILRRALNFFGLRSYVPHDYEATVLPVVSVGDLGQPAVIQTLNSMGISNTIFTVQPNEVWRPILFTCAFTQTGGTVPPTGLVFEIRNPNNSANRFRFPMFFNTNIGETESLNPALNSTALPITVRFPPNFLIPSGWFIRFNIFLLIGDGSSVTVDNTLLFNRIQEPLVLPE